MLSRDRWESQICLHHLFVYFRAKHMYQQTKGIRGYLLNSLGQWVLQNFNELINLSNRAELLKGATLNSGEMSAMGNMLALIKKIVIIDHNTTKW